MCKKIEVCCSFFPFLQILLSKNLSRISQDPTLNVRERVNLMCETEVKATCSFFPFLEILHSNQEKEGRNKK